MTEMTVKVSLQTKIAELEGRIADLEKEIKELKKAGFTMYMHNTATGETKPISPEAKEHWDKMWVHFDQMFGHMGKMFKKVFGD